MANKAPVIHDTDVRETLTLLEWLDQSIWLNIKLSLLNGDNFKVVFRYLTLRKTCS